MPIGVKFEPILPPEFKEGVIRLHMLNTGRKIGRGIRQDFQRTVSTFEHKPEFVLNVGFPGTQLKVEVFTTDFNYIRISEGSEGGTTVLSPLKTAWILPATYTAKTIPGVINARSGGASEHVRFIKRGIKKLGGYPSFPSEKPPKFVRNALGFKGIKPRKFDETVLKIWEPKFEEMLQEGLDHAAEMTGHGM